MDKQQTICVHSKPGAVDRCKRKLYSRQDCLDWLLSYAADEQYFRGVERFDPAQCEETDSHSRGNVAAVADLRMEWNFGIGTKTWTAKFVAGEFQGIEKRLPLDALTNEHWQKMKADCPYDGDLPQYWLPVQGQRP